MPTAYVVQSKTGMLKKRQKKKKKKENINIFARQINGLPYTAGEYTESAGEAEIIWY